MSSELSVGGQLAKAATELLNEMDPDTFLHGIKPLRKALESWATLMPEPSGQDRVGFVSPAGLVSGYSERTAAFRNEIVGVYNIPLYRRPVLREPVVVELPSFAGYLPHVVDELQASFTQACERAGIKVNRGTAQ